MVLLLLLLLLFLLAKSSVPPPSLSVPSPAPIVTTANPRSPLVFRPCACALCSGFPSFFLSRSGRIGTIVDEVALTDSPHTSAAVARKPVLVEFLLLYRI